MDGSDRGRFLKNNYFLCSWGLSLQWIHAIFWIIRKTLRVIEEEEQQIEMCAWRFPGSSAGKESSCNARDSGLISGLGRSLGEGIGHPLQYSRASLVAQIVKNPPAMWETWDWSLGQEDPLEESMATHSSILTWRIPPGQRNLAGYSPWGRKESDMTEQLSATQHRRMLSFRSCSLLPFFCCSLLLRKERSRYSLFPLPSVQQWIVIPENVHTFFLRYYNVKYAFC